MRTGVPKATYLLTATVPTTATGAACPNHPGSTPTWCHQFDLDVGSGSYFRILMFTSMMVRLDSDFRLEDDALQFRCLVVAVVDIQVTFLVD